MYKLIAFNEVSKNFTAHFGVSISPYFDRQTCLKTGRVEFITHKFVKYLMKNLGYGGSSAEPLERFICRRFGDSTWAFLKRLM